MAPVLKLELTIFVIHIYQSSMTIHVWVQRPKLIVELEVPTRGPHTFHTITTTHAMVDDYSLLSLGSII